MPSELYVDGPALDLDEDEEHTLLISNDTFSGTVRMNGVEIQDQNWDILWFTGGGTYDEYKPLPSDNWHAVMGSPWHEEGGEDSYLIWHIDGDSSWSGGEFQGTINGKDMDYNSYSETYLGGLTIDEGDVVGTYDGEGNWQILGMDAGVSQVDLQFGGRFDGDFSYFDTGPGEMVDSDNPSSHLSGILGGTESLWAGSPYIVMGEFNNPDNYKLWTEDNFLQGRTVDGGSFLGVIGGIK